jgi:site-specific DNA recombinase
VRAAVYVRISADREGRELGVERQLDYCRAICDRGGWTIVETFSDNDLSASRQSRKPRPNYQQMLRMAREGQLDVIVAYSTSRLTRRPREFEDLIDLAEHGVRIVTDRSGDLNLNTARGRRRARDDAARDAEYAEELSELAKAEREQRRKAGRWNGGARPFGWESDGVTPRPREQDLIRSAAQDVLAGRSLASIARSWTAGLGTSARGRSRWRPGTVRDVLRNPRVAGMLPDERPAKWPAILPEEQWRGVAAVLADPARRNEHGPTRLLTGIAVCGLCEATVHGGTGHGHAATYRCSAQHHLDRLAEPVDAFVRDVVLRYLEREKVTLTSSGDAGALAQEATALRARLNEAADLFADGAITGQQLTRTTATLTAALDETEARMAAAASASALAGLPLTRAGLDEWWQEVDPERHRMILRALDMRIVIFPPGRGVKAFDPESVVIEWRTS